MEKKVKEYYIKGEFYDWVTHPRRLEKIFHKIREKVTVRLIEEYGSRSSISLDIGCGTGLITRHMREYVLGVDVNRWNLKRARIHVPRMAAILADAERLPLRSDSIDMIICTEVLEHVPSPQRVLEEIGRIMREGSVFIGSTPSTTPIWKLRKILTSTCLVTEPFHRNYTINEIRELLERIRGLKVIDIFKDVFQLTLFFVVEKLSNRRKVANSFRKKNISKP